MKSKFFPRLVALFLMFFLILNCVSSDDGENNLTVSNKAKIIGVWYNTNRCQEQNNYMFNANLSYEELNSNYIECSDNEFNTYKYTGTYNINNNELFFNQQTDEVFIEGTGLTVQEFELHSIKYKIEVLNDTSLQIKTTITTDTHVTNYSNSFER